jgi:signal transduction histidine kinase
MQRILRGEVLKNYEICFRRLDTGETRIFSYSGSIVHYENDKQLAFIKFQNITEHRRAETSLQEAQAQLLHSQKMEAVGLLAGGIAHDFNNALGVILGYCELLRERMAADDVNRKYVQQILNAEERAASLTHQLLAFSRKQLMNPAILDLNTVVRGMEEMVRRLIGADISLQLFCDTQLPGIKADYGQLEQVLMNLAVNSRDAMPQGGTLTIRTAYGEPVSDDAAKNPGIRDGKFVMLCVTDTGCGMDKATQERIFEPFFTTKEIGKGTGLGLSTTYGIVQQSGGCICLESAPGVGTTFRIYFPVAEEIPPPGASAESLWEAGARLGNRSSG